MTFLRCLSAGEVWPGGLLLLPAVPSRVAGLGLLGFSTALVGLYAKAPGMRRPGSVLPTQDGIPLSKDSWLVAIAGALVLGGQTGTPGGD
jgi:hypothetical protein